MSWWDDGDDVLGDGPADRLVQAWRVILGARARAGHAKPALAEALEAFALALRSPSLQSPSRGIALLRGDAEIGRFEGASAAADLDDAFATAITHISQEYRQRFDRAPHPSELIKTLEFVIGYDTETYLSDASVWVMRDLRLRAV